MKLTCKNNSIFVRGGGLLVIIVLLFAGCKESSETSSRKESAQSVDTAQRLIRASQEKLPLTQAEVGQAFENKTERDAQRLAKKIANRQIDQLGKADWDQAFNELERLSAKIAAGDSPDINIFCDKLLTASGRLLELYQAVDDLSAVPSGKRLAQAEATLNEAVRQARQENIRPAQVGPEITLGTVRLIQARSTQNKLRHQELDMQKIQIYVNHLAGIFRAQQSYAQGLEQLRPDNAIEMLQAQVADAHEKLTQAQHTLQQLNTQLEQVQQDLDSNTTQARQLQQKYLALLAQADKYRSEKKYQLQQQAYMLRSGNENEYGGIYYEAQAELIENDKSVLQSKIAFQQFMQNKLTENIANIDHAIDQLRNSPQTTSDIDNSIASSRDENQRLLLLLQNRLSDFKKAEDEYRQTRVGVVGSYNKAIESFSNAQRHAERRSPTAQYAQKLADMASEELALLWQRDAGFYDAAAKVIAMTQDIPQTQQATSALVKDYQNQAQQARTSATDLASDQSTDD